MKPTIKLAECKTHDGHELKLFEHNGDYEIHVDGLGLMRSRQHTSELQLAEIGMERLDPEAPARILIGGLGLGYTLRQALESGGPKTKIFVAELIPEVVEWNKTHLADLNGSLLDDRRVRVKKQDVVAVIRKALREEPYDVILLDVDNGPDAMVTKGNRNLYDKGGIRMTYAALKPGGRVVYWSAGKNRIFENRLIKSGYEVQMIPALAYPSAKKPTVYLYVCDRVEVPPPERGEFKDRVERSSDEPDS